VAGYDTAFLAAIDRTLAVFARDRLQSARDWINVIEGRAARPEETDETILEKIRDLVETTNVEVREVQERMAREKAERARAEAEAKAAAETARRRRMEAARREAEEFAREMREREREARAAQRATQDACDRQTAHAAEATPASPDGQAAATQPPAVRAAGPAEPAAKGASDIPAGREDAPADLAPGQQAGHWRVLRAGPRTDEAGAPGAELQASAWREARAPAAEVEEPPEPEGEEARVPARTRARGLFGFALGGRRGRQSA
jgi:hypothetical protein